VQQAPGIPCSLSFWERISANLGRKSRREMGGRFKEAHDYRDRILNEGTAPFKCRAGSRYLYIDEFGSVNWCSQTRNIWSKPLMDYTLDDLREQFFTHKSCNATCTIGCARSASQLDNWRSQPVTSLAHIPVKAIPKPSFV